jgi:hypothetical protein
MNNQINFWIKEGLCTGECTAVHFPTVGNYNEFLVSFKGLIALANLGSRGSVILLKGKISNENIKLAILDAYSAYRGNVPTKWLVMDLTNAKVEPAKIDVEALVDKVVANTTDIRNIQTIASYIYNKVSKVSDYDTARKARDLYIVKVLKKF